MSGRLRKGAFLLFLILILIDITPVGAGHPAGPVLSVKLSLEPPVTLRWLGPAALLYQPEKSLDQKPHLAPTSWREVKSGTINPQLTWQVKMAEGRIILASEKGDLITADLPLMLLSSDGSGFELKGATYPGGLLLWPEDGLLFFFNEVPLEDYVCGVLGSEAYAGWPFEALKANAVAIRSYTLYSLGKHETFDLCDTIHCQVYRGLPREEVFREAVTATAYEVLSWNGAPVNAVYHSSSGGRTRNNEEVWAGTPLPYLRSVEDYDHNGRNYQWPRTYLFTGEELAQALGFPAGQKLGVTPFYSATGERLGYWFDSDGMGKHLKNEELRRLLSLPSANFRIFIEAEQREINQTVTLAPGTTIQISGNGAGHGVGLSQWGAAALAARGYSYQQILGHYYGSEVCLAEAREMVAGIR